MFKNILVAASPGHLDPKVLRTAVKLAETNNARLTVLDVIQQTILPIKEKFDSGPSIPYNITGMMNRHPRTAMAFREGATPDAYTEFYDQTMADV